VTPLGTFFSELSHLICVHIYHDFIFVLFPFLSFTFLYLYNSLEASRIHSWKDLIVAFIRQYQYNIDMTPDRTQLQNMSKMEHESFKEYAQRWRDLAAQVTPPMWIEK